MALDDLDGATAELEEAVARAPDFAAGWALLGRVRIERYRRSFWSRKYHKERFLRDAPLLAQAEEAFRRARTDGPSWGLDRMDEEAVAEKIARAMAVVYVEKDPNRAREAIEAAHAAAPSEEYASLLGFSLESLVIDNDIIGATQRTIKGIEINDDRLSFETIRDVCLNGPGHFLGSAQTLELMQTEYLYPAAGDRRSPNEWVEQGSRDALERAAVRVREILATHYPDHVPEAVDTEIRRRHPVKLPRAAMQPTPAPGAARGFA